MEKKKQHFFDPRREDQQKEIVEDGELVCVLRTIRKRTTKKKSNRSKRSMIGVVVLSPKQYAEETLTKPDNTR